MPRLNELIEQEKHRRIVHGVLSSSPQKIAKVTSAPGSMGKLLDNLDRLVFGAVCEDNKVRDHVIWELESLLDHLSD